MKDIKLEDVLPINAMQYFTHFISTPDAKYNYLIAKGHSDVEVGPWSPCKGRNNCFQRISIFSTNLSNNALVKKLTGSVSLKITETQRYYFEPQGDLHVESTMEFSGSSLAENFSSEIEWTVRSREDKKSSDIACFVKTGYKGFMFKGLIEKYVHQAACDSFHSWVKSCREKISSFDEPTHDQSVPTSSYDSSSSSSTPIPDDEDDDEDDVFYDSVEIPVHKSFSTSSSSSSSPSPSPHPSSSSPHPSSSFSSFSSLSSSSSSSLSHPPKIISSRPLPPLTATLPAPYPSATSPNHVIFATYSAGRPSLSSSLSSSSLLRTTSPPPASSSSVTLNLSSSSTPITSSSFTPLQNNNISFNPTIRGWESAENVDRRTIETMEEHKRQFTRFAEDTRDREREMETRIARMAARMESQTLRTRRMFAVLAAFAVVWPALARWLVKLMRWLWPLLRQRIGK